MDPESMLLLLIPLRGGGSVLSHDRLSGFIGRDFIVAAAPELDQAKAVTKGIGQMSNVTPRMSLDFAFLGRPCG
jgi:hypothetical protein